MARRAALVQLQPQRLRRKAGLLGRHGRLAVVAQLAHQALGQHTDDGGGDQVRLHPHVDQAHDGAQGAVGVQS